MKFRILVGLLSRLLGAARDENAPRPDMHLPDKLLAFGSVLVVGGLALCVSFFFVHKRWMLPVGILAILLGVAAILCWRNQKIWMVSQEEFTYTTFLGNTYTYRFDQITGLRQNSDSLTLFVADQKVHMEAMAIISQRLAERINQVLRNKA